MQSPPPACFSARRLTFPCDLFRVYQSGVPLERDIVEQVVARCAMGDGNADYNQLLAMLGQQ